MRLPEPEQTRLQTYWSKIKTRPRFEKTFDAFVRDYLTVETKGKRETADEDLLRLPAALWSDQLGRRVARRPPPRAAPLHRYHAVFGWVLQRLIRWEPLARLRRLVDVPAPLVDTTLRLPRARGTVREPPVAGAIELIEAASSVARSAASRRAATGRSLPTWPTIDTRTSPRELSRRPRTAARRLQVPDRPGVPNCARGAAHLRKARLLRPPGPPRESR